MYECRNMDCESMTFEQVVVQVETVHVDEAGQPAYIESDDIVETREVKCAGCGTEVKMNS